MMLRIGTFSRRGRVSVKALRHYEAIGLLKPAHVDGATGYRSYEPSQLDDLHRLMVLRALGLPLERIRILLQDDPSPDLMRRLLAERRATVARRIDAEQAQLAAIQARIRHLEDAQPTYDIVLREVPAVLVASLRRVVPDYGAVDSMLDEIARTLPKTARIAGHGAVWHHCAPHKRQIDCEAMVLLERPISAPRDLKFYQLPACRAGRPSQRRGSFRPGLYRRLGSRRRPAIRARTRPDARALLLKRRRFALRPHRDPVSASSVRRSHRMTVTLSSPNTLPPPTGYSQIAEVTSGKIVLIAGQVAHDAAGNLVGENDFAAQVEQVFKNLDAAVRAAGGTFHDIVKINNYCVASIDLAEFAAFRTVRDRYVNTAAPPVSTFVFVSRLVRPGWLFEIDAMAVIGA